MTAVMANASMTSETWRCQPCQERVSLWSRPSSFLAVSKLSSMAQRWAFHRHQLLHGRALGAPCREEGQAAIGDVAADQKTPRPFPGKVVVVLTDFEIGPPKTSPGVPTRP